MLYHFIIGILLYLFCFKKCYQSYIYYVCVFVIYLPLPCFLTKFGRDLRCLDCSCVALLNKGQQTFRHGTDFISFAITCSLFFYIRPTDLRAVNVLLRNSNAGETGIVAIELRETLLLEQFAFLDVLETSPSTGEKFLNGMFLLS